MTADARQWSIESARGTDPLDALTPELDPLLERINAPVCARSLWLTTWAHAFTEFTPWTIAVREHDELAAVALLAERVRAGHLEIVALGHGPSDYARIPARSPDAARVLAEALASGLRQRRRAWRLRFEGLPVADPVATQLTSLLPQSARVPAPGAPWLRLDADRSVDDLLSAKDRRSMRARTRRVAESPGGYHVVTDRGQAVLPHLAGVERVHELRDHAIRDRSDLDKPSERRFWNAVLEAYATRDEVEVSRLLVGPDLAAYAIGLLDGSTWRLWDTRINPAYHSVAPGRILLLDVLERLNADQAWSAFDYMRGEEEYKQRLADDVVPSEHLHAWSSAGLRTLERGFQRLRRIRHRAT